MTPPLSGMKAVKALMEEFDSIDAYLQAVHEIVQEGHMPDIADLDNRVAHLCAAVDGVDTDVQGRCLKKLDELLGKLNACEDEMTAFHKNQLKSKCQ
jgi:hypothetical protein